MFKSYVAVQAIGCTETGTRFVLSSLLKAVPKDFCFVVVTTSSTARSLCGSLHGKIASNVHIIGVSHAVFGRFLRLPFELIFALLAITKFMQVVNLSHYGLCFGGDYSLYIHSPLLMDPSHSQGWGEGKSNFLKRIFLNSCIRNARCIVVQTSFMGDQLVRYCKSSHLCLPTISILRPKLRPIPSVNPKRTFAFQFFYPASRFPHKRSDLAAEASKILYERQDDIGLVITVEPRFDDHQCLLCLGRITPNEVQCWFSGSDVLLFTSERETLGLPILEAMQIGLPVVAPRLPYAEELLGDAGCYFDSPTPQSVASAMALCRSRYLDYKVAIRQRYSEFVASCISWEEHWPVLVNKNSF